MKNSNRKIYSVGLLVLTLLVIYTPQLASGYIPGVTYLTYTYKPSDKTGEVGTSVSVYWKAVSDFGGKGYTIYKNGVAVKSGTWSSNVAITYSYTPSQARVDELRCRVYDSYKALNDYCYITVYDRDTDGDGLSDIVETYYTKTPINVAEDFTGPTVDVQVLFRDGAASVTLDGRLDSNGYGTIPRKLYHSIQKSICTLTSNIVKIIRTDNIKVLQIDTWDLTYYGSHGLVVSECMIGQTLVQYVNDWERDSHDIDDGGVLQGLLNAEAEGYDLICIALSGSFSSSEQDVIDRLVKLSTQIICGTGNDDLDYISGKSAYKHTIAIGGAWISIFNPGSVVDVCNYGREMDFVCNCLGPINAPTTATSWATGYCTGYAINMLCANQNLDPVTLRDLMRQCAEKIEEQDYTYGVYPYFSTLSWPDYGWCDVFGYGYIDYLGCYQQAVAQLSEPY